MLAIIPARSGSKGLPDKNIKPLLGKPLIAYTIEAAIQSQCFKDIIVSTDSPVYAEIAKQYGANVPFLRKDSLSNDKASTVDVVCDVLTELENRGKTYKQFMLLQPTSPLRNATHIKECVQTLIEKEANAVVSMCPCEHPIEWSKNLESDLCLDGLFKASGRRQEEKKAYRLNGAMYLANTKYFLEEKNFYKEKCFAYIMSTYDSVDIDSIEDFLSAEALLKYRLKV